MKTKIIIYLTVLISIILTAGDDIITWSRTYNGPFNLEDIAHAIEQTSDGGYIVAGVKWDVDIVSPDWIFPHAWILKLDAYGDTLWTTTYYYNVEISDFMYNDYYYYYTEAYDVKQTSDGGYVICGYTEVNEGDFFWEAEKRMFILKLDESGTIDWYKTYLEGRDNIATSIEETSDGGFIIGGTIRLISDSDSTKYDRFAKILRVNITGDTLWTRNYQISEAFLSGVKSTNLRKICITEQDEIFGIGTTYDGVSSNGWIIKIDKNGDEVWSKNYGGNEAEGFYDIHILTDNNLIVIGIQYLRNDDATGVWLNKISFDGDLIWSKTIHSGLYNRYDYGKSIQQTEDGGFIIGAETTQSGETGRDWWIIKTDEFGDTLWTRIYGSNTYNLLGAIKQTQDGGYIIAGSAEGSFPENNMDWTDIWVLKLDEYGYYTGIENNNELLINEYKLYQNYPNPFNPVTQIKFALAKTADVKLSVYNINGQLVSKLASGTMNAGHHAVDFDGSRLNSGIYYYTLEVDGKAITKRMVLTK